MSSLLGLLVSVALPLVIGYAIPVHRFSWQKYIVPCLHLTINALLFSMGLLFGVDQDIHNNLVKIGFIGLVAFIILTICNLLALMAVARLRHMPKCKNTIKNS